jgi:hypothetical protein
VCINCFLPLKPAIHPRSKKAQVIEASVVCLIVLVKIVTKRSFYKGKRKKCIGVKYEREDSEYLGASAFKATSPVHTQKGVKLLQSHGTQVN